MELSDYISFLALLSSMFTFYWTSIREKRAFYLVRVKSSRSRMNPEFALINAGGSDILVTSIFCAFDDECGGLYAPEIVSLGEVEGSFSILPGKTVYCKVEFLKEDVNEKLANGGSLEDFWSMGLYKKNMKVIVEWVDRRGLEFKAEPKISKYGFEEDGFFRTVEPLQKKHDLYKICS